MSRRIERRFAALRKKGQSGLVTFTRWGEIYASTRHPPARNMASR